MRTLKASPLSAQDVRELVVSTTAAFVDEALASSER
jgi:hypothetical protein